jgi:hypothetical protein
VVNDRLTPVEQPFVRDVVDDEDGRGDLVGLWRERRGQRGGRSGWKRLEFKLLESPKPKDGLQATLHA